MKNWLKRIKLKPAHWAVFIFVMAQAATFAIISRMDSFLESKDIYIPPQSSPEGGISFWPAQPPATTTPGVEPAVAAPFWTSLGPMLIYFFSVVIVMGLILFVIPMSVLKKIMRLVFSLLFAWGVFIALVFWVPVTAAIIIAAAVGLLWLITPRVWLHNIAMILAMASMGAVFGRMISPWTAMALLGVIAVYDFFAVRFGYMIWLADKLSETVTLPAFFIPRFVSEWRGSLKEKRVAAIAEIKTEEREFSILGGGDIGFPILLVSSVFFAYGFNSALLVAGFALAGVIGAYWIQATFLKGKAMPALPPIALLSLIGVLIII